MDENPFDGLTLRETEQLERIYRARYPFRWWLAVAWVALLDPPAAVRSWALRRAIGYDGRPHR